MRPKPTVEQDIMHGYALINLMSCYWIRPYNSCTYQRGFYISMNGPLNWQWTCESLVWLSPNSTRQKNTEQGPGVADQRNRTVLLWPVFGFVCSIWLLIDQFYLALVISALCTFLPPPMALYQVQRRLWETTLCMGSRYMRKQGKYRSWPPIGSLPQVSGLSISSTISRAINPFHSKPLTGLLTFPSPSYQHLLF